jgi:hypothetical protein
LAAIAAPRSPPTASLVVGAPLAQAPAPTRPSTSSCEIVTRVVDRIEGETERMTTTETPPTSPLRALLVRRPAIDLLSPSAPDASWFAAAGVDARGPEALPLAAELRALRRVVRVLAEPDVSLALSLLERGVRSALPLAEMPRAVFAAKLGDLFAGDASRMDAVQARARAVRHRVMLASLHRHESTDPRLPRAIAPKRS